MIQSKSLSGANRRIRTLQKSVKERDKLIQRLIFERNQMARLASDTPQFFNPLHVIAAKRIRDEILSKL